MGTHEAELCIASVSRANSKRSVLPDSSSELACLGFIKKCTWIALGLGPKSWAGGHPMHRLSFQPREDMFFLRPWFHCSAHPLPSLLCHPPPPIPSTLPCLLIGGPQSKHLLYKVVFYFPFQILLFLLSQMISQCFRKEWTSDLLSMQSNKASRQQWHKQQYPLVNAAQCSRASERLKESWKCHCPDQMR